MHHQHDDGALPIEAAARGVAGGDDLEMRAREIRTRLLRYARLVPQESSAGFEPAVSR
jgi:hypothetical protein